MKSIFLNCFPKFFRKFSHKGCTGADLSGVPFFREGLVEFISELFLIFLKFKRFVAAPSLMNCFCEWRGTIKCHIDKFGGSNYFRCNFL